MSNKNKNFFKHRSQESENFLLKWVFISLFISLVLIIGVLSFTQDRVKVLDEKFSSLHQNIKYSASMGRKENILILGVDSNGKHTDPFKGTRTDTIIIANIDPLTKTMNVISVPRDSKVYLSNEHGVNKINSAHAIGGVNLTKRTLEETLGIKINHYILANYEGIKNIIDATGGVSVDVKKNMYYRDKTAGLTINLKKGSQVLNSSQVEQYLRFRNDKMGDIGRMHRQQWFLQALAKKFKSPSILPKIPKIVRVAHRNIKTDMNLYELSQLAAYAQALDVSKVQFATLPGHPSQKGRLSYWILEPDNVQDLIDKFIYRQNKYQPKKDLTVSLLYSEKTEEYVSQVKEVLGELGYKLECKDITTLPYNQIVSHSDYVNIELASIIKKKIPSTGDFQFILAKDTYLCGKTDFSIVLVEK